MKTIITITDGGGGAPASAAPAVSVPQAGLEAVDAGAAPADSSAPSVGNGSRPEGGEDGGPAPEWLRELIESTAGPSAPGEATGPTSAGDVSTMDAGAAPAD